MPEASDQSERHAFVYGTLRRGDANDITALKPAPVYVGEAQIPGRMFNLGDYPGVLLGGEAYVIGEVYRITPALELRLDEIEMLLPEPTGEYYKRDILVLVAGRELHCIVYEINPAHVVGKPLLPSGDWVRGR